MLPTSRFALRLLALVCIAALAVALISQHLFGMRPCAWCVLQRFILLVIAVISLLASAGRESGAWQRLGAFMIVLASASGVTAAWYQYRVAAVSFSCAQTFADRFMTESGLDGALPWLFGIQASCSDARVSLLGLEYALWGLACFLVCALLSAWVLLRKA
ncbi:disulfide bond formation protein B [Castellaniella sp.]|uniref:disulfide bond formation protein B n=1 Tax=Castellaniella sp. TaxID=1955812 RepID=UPI0035603766